MRLPPTLVQPRPLPCRALFRLLLLRLRAFLTSGPALQSSSSSSLLDTTAPMVLPATRLTAALTRTALRTLQMSRSWALQQLPVLCSSLHPVRLMRSSFVIMVLRVRVVEFRVGVAENLKVLP